jgi:hypothetical protein
MDESRETSPAAAADAKTVDLAREDLFEQAWTVPMQRLAERYGFSDVALAKTCRKLAIPVPPRGYWRRKETGRLPPRPPLPRPRPGAGTSVTLRLERKPEPPSPSPDVAARIAYETLPDNRIQVSDRLVRPHPLVRETAAVLRRRPASGDPTQPWTPSRRLDFRVTLKELGRALRIFDALIKALEARDIPVRVATDDRRQTQIELFGEKVAFWLDEKAAPHPHVPTAAESRDGATARRKWDHVRNGQLRLRIVDHALQGTRKAWSDSPRTRLEDLLNDFVVGLTVAADGLRARTLYWQRWREEQEEARRLHELAEQRRKEEEERIRELDEQVDGWDRAQKVRTFVDEAERRATTNGISSSPDTELGQWVSWARRHADELDPFVPPPRTPVPEDDVSAEENQ